MAGGTLLSLWAKKQATPASKGPEGSCAAKSEGVEESRSPSSESPVVPLCADASEGAGGRTEEDSAYPVNSASKVALSPSADQKDQGAQGLRLETRLGPGAAEEEDPDSRAALLFSLRKEEARVRSIVMETPPLSAAGKAKDVAMPAEGLQASEVARMIHGSGEPLSSLSVSLSESLGVTNPTAVHNCIISLAVRTSFAAKDSRADTVDALEDVTEDLLWRWTVRDVKVMNKEDRAEASKLTKQLQGWQQRLSLLREAVSMLEAATWERLPAKGKLPKLLSRLDKLGSSADGAFELRKATAGAKVAKTGEGKDTKESKAKTKDSPGREKGIAGDGKSEDAVAAGKADAHVQIAVPSESTAKKTGKENLTTGNGDEKGSLMAEKKRLKAEQESLQAEKKRLKAEKERLKSEKERLKAEKEAEREADKQKAMAEKERTRAAREEKERLKAEKEAEKVRLRLEKEAEAAEVKKKRQAEEEEGHAKRKAARLGFGSSKQLESAQGVMQSFFAKATPKKPRESPEALLRAEPEVSPPGSEHPEEGVKRHGDYFKMFVPCEPSQRCPLVSPPLAGEELEALDRHLRSRAGGEPEGRGKEALLKRWKGLRSSGPRTRVAGLPPSWARKASRGRTPVLPPGTDPGSVVTFRRKLIQKDTKAPRPAYYGSWSRASASVAARRPFAKDESMDYEVESEWDWEEEEDPGESLSDGDEDGEEMAGEDGSDCDMDGEGIVPDGYLSADEGCCEEAEMMDMDCGAAEVAGGEGRSFGALTISNSAELKKLQVLLDKAKRSHKCLIVTRIAGDAAEEIPWQLQALEMQFVPGAEPIGVPRPEGLDDVTPHTHAKDGPGRKPAAFPADLEGVLLRFLLDNPRLAINKATDSFIAMQADTKLAKKTVKTRILQMADFQSGANGGPKFWNIRTELLAEHGLKPASSPPPKPSKEGTGPVAVKASKTPVAPTKAQGVMKSNAIDRFLRPAAATSPQPKGQSASSSEPPQSSPAPPTPDAARHGGIIEDTTGAKFWQEVRQWLVKGGSQGEPSQAKGFAFAAEPCVMDSIKSMPADIFAALIKSMAAVPKAPFGVHAAEAAANIAAALRARLQDVGKEEGAARQYRAWPPVVTLHEVLSQPGLLNNCLTALAEGVQDIKHHVAKLLATLLQPFEGKRHVREQEAADKLCLGMAKSQGLLQSLATLMADGAPEGFKASAYAAMALREAFVRGSGAEEDCTAAVNPFAVVGEAAARAVGGVNNPKHLPVAKHAMRLVAAMLARPESRELVAGPPPLSLEEDGLAAALLSGVAVALSSRQSSSMSSALEVAGYLVDADGEVRQCLEVLAGSSGGGGEIVGPNIAALWEGLQNAAALQDLPQEVGEMARGAVARVLQRGCSNSMQA